MRVINDAIHGNIVVNDVENQLIQTKEFCRLGGIKQLSFGQIKYPSATHTRYNHSIGALAVTTMYLDWLKLNSPKFSDIIEENYKLIRVGALLHDIGHSAFSHSIEQALSEHEDWYGSRINHEVMSKSIILKASGVNKVLKKYFSDAEIKKIAAIATGEYEEIDKKLRFLVDIVTGDFGSDRVDYLLRDSHHAGLAYGKIEFEQLISKICIKEVGSYNRLCIKFDESRLGVYAGTALQLARYYHFSSLVFQPDIRCLNVLLKFAIEEYLNGIKDKKEEIDKLFREYDDARFLEVLQKSKLNGLKKADTLIKSIKDISTEGIHNQYEYIDNILPIIGFLIHIILKDSKTYREFRKSIEENIRKLYKIDKNEFIVFDAQINGKSGITSEMFIDVEPSYSTLAQDKSPILEKLSQHLASVGSVGVYSSVEIKSKINFNELLFEKAKKFAQKARVKSRPSEEYLLLKLKSLSLGVKESPFFKLCDTDFPEMIPAFSRLTRAINDDKKNPYKNFEDIGFIFSKDLYEDLMILAGFSLINIVYKPVGIGEKGPIGDPEKNVKSVRSIVKRLDFYVTRKGNLYIKDILKIRFKKKK